jgi:hypothetical protein
MKQEDRLMTILTDLKIKDKAKAIEKVKAINRAKAQRKRKVIS